MIVFQDHSTHQIVIPQGVELVWIRLMEGLLHVDDKDENPFCTVGQVIEIDERGLCEKMIFPPGRNDTYVGDIGSIAPVALLTATIISDKNTEDQVGRKTRKSRFDHAVQPVFEYRPKNGGQTKIILQKPFFRTDDIEQAEVWLNETLEQRVSELQSALEVQELDRSKST